MKAAHSNMFKCTENTANKVSAELLTILAKLQINILSMHYIVAKQSHLHQQLKLWANYTFTATVFVRSLIAKKYNTKITQHVPANQPASKELALHEQMQGKETKTPHLKPFVRACVAEL